MSEFGVMQRPEDEDETQRWEAQKERRTVMVDTEFGRKCLVELERRREGVWTVHISQELIDTAPEGLVAALTMAVMEMKPS